jgi:hypothetical protein
MSTNFHTERTEQNILNESKDADYDCLNVIPLVETTVGSVAQRQTGTVVGAKIATDVNVAGVLPAGTNNIGKVQEEALGGTGTDGTVALAVADTWYQVPAAGSVPAASYVLIVTKENEAGVIRWSFSNGGTPSATNGNTLVGDSLIVSLKSGQVVYFGSSTAGDDVNWTAKEIT